MSPAHKKNCILYLSAVDCLGGAERSLLDLIENLDRGIYFPVVALPGSGTLSERMTELGIQTSVVPFPRLKRGWRPFRLMKSAQALRAAAGSLRKILQDHQVSLIHANGIQAMMCAAFIRGKLPPIFWHVRDRADQPGFLIDRLVKKSSRVLAISSAVQKELERHADAPEKVELVLNGIETEPFESVRSLGQVPCPTVGMIANFYPWKGHRDFLHIAAKVREKSPEVRFLVAGSDLLDEQPEYIEELLCIRNSLDLEESVEFLGQVNDVSHFLSEVQILAIPAHGEPFGRCAVEAMAAGRPVVSWEVGGPLDIIEQEKTGALVAPYDLDAFASTLTRLLASVRVMEALGQAGRATAKRRFHRSVMAREVQRLYEDTIG